MNFPSLRPGLWRPVAGLAATLSLALVATGCTPHNPDTGPVTRVLQSVDVSLASDASVAGIRSTTISVGDDPSKARTETQSHAPQEAVGDLPVRVTTSYRTTDRTGTNLADLQGYTGRVQIEVVVENLTVRPKTVNYDVDGTQQTRTALVAVPMTVVASTTLAGTPAASVVTGNRGAQGVTNGVLSQTDRDEAAVQWAAILAPPQLNANATLRLVSDVRDFQVPRIAVTVQPGMVTDPSVATLLDSTFNSSSSSELDLQRRTIGVISDVNEVLARSSKTIGGVRKSLDASAKTLGSKTVRDLKQSTTSTAQSVKTLDGQLKSLRKELQDTLKTNRNSMLQQLSATVAMMDSMLGDTTGRPTTPAVSGSGCNMKVASPSEAGDVYGNLLQVAGQLEGYASATEGCRVQALATLKASFGPAQPTMDICRQSTSVSCSLLNTQLAMTVSLAKIAADSEKVVDSLDPDAVDKAQSALEDLGKKLDDMATTTAEFTGSTTTDLESLRKASNQVATDATNLGTNLTSVKQGLSALKAEAGIKKGAAEAAKKSAQTSHDKMSVQMDAVIERLCHLEPGEMPPPTVKPLDPTPSPTVNPSPSPTVEPTPTLTIPTPGTPTPDPTTTPGPSTDPTATPQPSVDPTLTPTVDPTGTPPADPTVAPTTIPPMTPSSAAAAAAPTPAPTSTLTPVPTVQVDADDVRVLIDERSCNGWPAFNSTWPTGLKQQMGQQLDDQRDAWDGQIEFLDAILAMGTDEMPWAYRDMDVAAQVTKVESSLKTLGKDVTSLQDAVKALTEGEDSDYSRLPELTKLIEAMKSRHTTMEDQMGLLATQQDQLGSRIESAFKDSSKNAAINLNKEVGVLRLRILSQSEVDSKAISDMFTKSVQGLGAAGDDITANGTKVISAEKKQLQSSSAELARGMDSQVKSNLSSIATSVSGSSKDLTSAGAQLQADLNKVLLDLGERKVKGTGLLGSMTTNAAKVGSADYQLALASGTATNYASVRGGDIDGILMRQAQLRAGMEAEGEMPAFRVQLPPGTESQTVYNFTIGGAQ